MANTLAVQILHLLVPISALTAYVSCRLVATSSVKTAKQRNPKDTSVELPLRVLQFCAAASYFGELIVSAIQTWQRESMLLPDDLFIYLAGSAFLFLYLSLNKSPGMHHYLASSVAVLGLEIILYLVSAPLSTVTLIWHIARISTFGLIVTLALAALLQSPSNVQDHERDPLLNGHAGANGTTKANKPDDGNESDADGESSDISYLFAENPS